MKVYRTTALGILSALAATTLPAAAAAPPEVAQLKVFQGQWTCTGEQADSVFGAGHALLTETTGRFDLDGYWMVVRFEERKTKANDHPTKGVYDFGYDPAAKQFVVNWIDSLGGWGRQSSPGWQADTLTLTGDYNTGGQRLGARDTFQKKGERSFVHRAELQKGDGSWVQLIDETCKK